MKTLRSQIILVSVLLLCAVVVYAWFSIRRSYDTQKLLSEYEIRNRITGYLNTAAGWQAIERGYGSTIIGSGKGDSSPLYPKFIEAGEKGDSIVLEIDKYKKELLSGKIFEDKLYSWLDAYGDMQDNRPRIAYKNISKYEWFEIATQNINAEFDLRNTTFTPQKKEEKILYLNNSIRSNIAKLCEYAGRQRAIIGNAIASGKPFTIESLDRIQHYRSIVEESLSQILVLKDLKFTSNQMKQAVEEFEEEFLRSFQLLREEVFAASKKQGERINVADMQIAKIDEMFKVHLEGIQKDLLSMGEHKSVVALAKALIAEEDVHLHEHQRSIENLFGAFTQVKKICGQIRFLDSSGHERVRVNFDGDTTRIIRGTQLQDKGNRYYFKKAINLLPGEVFTSPLDLNMENGEIEYPYKPVKRIATPVFVDGKQAGVVVFNLLADTSLSLHEDMEGEGIGDYILADQDGFYLHHPDEVKEWGMMESLNRSHHNIRQDYPGVSEQILSGKEGSTRLVSGVMILYKPFFLNFESDTGNFWVIIKEIAGVEYPVDAPTWFDRATTAINTGLAISDIAGEEADATMLELKAAAKINMLNMYIILGFAIIALISFVLWTRNRILRPIHKLTEISQKITKGDLTEPIVFKSNDEVGCLANAFERMRIKLGELMKDYEKAKKDWETTFDSAEDELRQSNTFNQTLVDTLPFGIDIVDDEGNILYISKRLESILGKKVIGKKCWSVYRDSKKQCEKCPLKKRSKTKRGTIESEEVLGGRIFQITHVDMLYKGKEALLEVFNDITDMKCTENDLRESHSEIEMLLASITSIIISLSPDHKITKWNKTAEATFGIDASSIVSKPFRESDIQWDWERVIEKVSICEKTNSSIRIDDLQYRRSDGSFGYLGVTVNPITNDASGQSGVLLLGSDVTERKDMEHQLMHAQKLESIGQLAAGIAHEINTPTQYITDNTKFLQDAFGDINKVLEKYSHLLETCKSDSVASELTAEIDVTAGDADINYLVEEVPNAISQSLEGLDRVKNIVYAMKNFSHPDNDNKKPIDINEAIKNTITVARNEWKYVAEVKTDFDLSLTSVPCFPGDFNQVILNLIVNAAHAIGGVSDNGGEAKGLITISTRCDGDWAEIRISDNGTGIPEDIRDRIFDPFFTTKEVGKGTGQGLSLVHSTVVGRHNGTITLDTEIGKGTTFIIRLPLCSSFSDNVDS